MLRRQKSDVYAVVTLNLDTRLKYLVCRLFAPTPAKSLRREISVDFQVFMKNAFKASSSKAYPKYPIVHPNG